jgi:IS4 transposase
MESRKNRRYSYEGLVKPFDLNHLYITNLQTDLSEPQGIAQLYGSRWKIEILFKERKSKIAILILLI